MWADVSHVLTLMMNISHNVRDCLPSPNKSVYFFFIPAGIKVKRSDLSRLTGGDQTLNPETLRPLRQPLHHTGAWESSRSLHVQTHIPSFFLSL